MFLLHDLLRQSASRFPDNTAIVAPKESISYAELDQRSDALAATLVAKGVTPGDPVGLAIHKCIDAIVAVYGILKTGACYVPIDPFAPAKRSAAIVANTELTTLVTSSDRALTLAKDLFLASDESTLTTIVTNGAVTGQLPEGLSAYDWTESVSSFEPLALTDTHLAYLLHTSGSTGQPKGVAITHRNALTFVDMATSYWNVTSSDKLCSQAPLHFDLSVFDLYVAAKAGAAIVLIPEFWAAFPKKMCSAIDAYGITIWNSVVSTLTLMMERGKPDKASFESLRAVIFSGEVMPMRYLRLLLSNMDNAKLYNVYGQTEANSSLVYPIDRENLPDSDGWKIPLGKPFPNFSVYALDSQGKQITSPGTAGELYVCASSVAAGYWGNPELSSEKFVVDPLRPHSGASTYKTGDLARLDEQGNYLFGGRSDEMIKSRGYRIELGDIDLSLLSSPQVESAATIALPDEEVGNRLYAYITLTSGGLPESDNIASVLSHCQSKLPKYMIPERVFVRENLPRTSTNKIDRKILRKELVAELRETS